MKSALTERQNQAYTYIRDYIHEHRKPPTTREIGQSMQMRSNNAVFKLLQVLVQKGYLTKDEKTSRGIKLTDTPDEDRDGNSPQLPLIAKVSSDEPELLQVQRQWMSVDDVFLRRADHKNCLIIRTDVDGMSNEGIRKNDYIIVEQMSYTQLENNCLAAFVVGKRMLVRRYSFANHKIHLQPADRNYAGESFSTETPECHVIGRVVGLMRRLLL